MQQTRIRLALKKGHHDSAKRLATEATALADARSDRLLGALFRAMQADSLVALGRPDDAGNLVAEAQAMINGSSLATLAEIERVRATVHASLGEQDEAADHFHRAVRLLTGVGSFLAKREAAQAVAAWYPEAAPDSRGNGGQAVAGRASGTLDWPPAPLQVHPSPSLDAASVESLAVLFPYASKPGVLGREVAALIARLDCASSIELRVHQPDGRDEVLERREHGSSTVPTTAVDIDAGSSRGRRYVVRVVPCNRLGARGAVTAVKQLAESAVALETARREEQERTSLWPGDVDLEDAGGLFVSGVMRELLANAHRVAASNVPVLLTGESGVGKEVIAREIHRRSPYAKGPFVPFNCTAAPRDMLDSQLFGHRRGAFTGALEHAPGIIRAAQGGTLFLDEIGELGLDSQPKLLRFLDSKEVFPIGEARPVHVDVRVIAATNAKLEQLLIEGRFREDLYYRLAIAPLHVPPLRERREEIPAFVNHFLELYAREAKRAPLDVTEEALEYLVLYRWPGNVRQLAAEMRRVALTAESGGNLTPELLSSEIRASRRTVDATQPIASPNELLVRIDQPLQVSLDQIERAAIERALAESRGRVEKAATLLRISRKGLFLKRRRLGLPIAER